MREFTSGDWRFWTNAEQDARYPAIEMFCYQSEPIRFGGSAASLGDDEHFAKAIEVVVRTSGDFWTLRTALNDQRLFVLDLAGLFKALPDGYKELDFKVTEWSDRVADSSQDVTLGCQVLRGISPNRVRDMVPKWFCDETLGLPTRWLYVPAAYVGSVTLPPIVDLVRTYPAPYGYTQAVSDDTAEAVAEIVGDVLTITVGRPRAGNTTTIYLSGDNMPQGQFIINWAL